MKTNTDSDFVGLQELKIKHYRQLQAFEAWATACQWERFHEAHYDWWMFPINQPSRLGFAYTVCDQEVDLLRKDADFMVYYLRGVELLLRSWGWDLYHKQPILSPAPSQIWAQWPIRLYKCAQSLQLFSCSMEWDSVMTYARGLLDSGEDFSFRGKDLSTYFR